jgi:alanyl-tRNA synthetase
VHSTGLNANDWAGVVTEKVGGKKGGKPEMAQGSGDKVDAVTDALSAAEAFAKLKLN